MAENPWPEFAKGRRRTVKTILMEMGSGIEERTEGTIKFHVSTMVEPSGTFHHRCELYVVPIGYTYPLFSVSHSASMFPAHIVMINVGNGLVSNNEEELVRILKHIFTSDATREVVEQLLDAAV